MWELPLVRCVGLGVSRRDDAIIDVECAKEQLWMLLFEQFLHPSGQIPAYEWEFSDLRVYRRVHAWAVWRVYMRDGAPPHRMADRSFLERLLSKRSCCSTFRFGLIG
jgi:hypothetical protein